MVELVANMKSSFQSSFKPNFIFNAKVQYLHDLNKRNLKAYI